MLCKVSARRVENVENRLRIFQSLAEQQPKLWKVSARRVENVENRLRIFQSLPELPPKLYNVCARTEKITNFAAISWAMGWQIS